MQQASQHGKLETSEMKWKVPKYAKEHENVTYNEENQSQTNQKLYNDGISG